MLRGRAALAVIAWCCAAGAAQGETPSPRLLEQARSVAAEIVQQVRSDLTRELQLSGPLRSVVVCKYSTPEITSNISRRIGARVTRVTLRPRNPALGAADAWEQKILLDFDRRAGRGDKPEAMEASEMIAEPQGRFFRYMKAIPVGEACLACHGQTDTMSSAVRSMLASEYPHDRAVGYSVGQVRGAVSVKIPL